HIDDDQNASKGVSFFMKIPILFEDNHLLVVEKPVNVPVQADQSNDEDLLNLLKNDIKIRYQKPGNVYLGLVHSLDRPVGGTMVFAKTSKAASRLSDVLRRKESDSSNVALLRGVPSKKEGTIEHYLWKDTRKNKVRAGKGDHADDNKTILTYKTIISTEDLSLLSIHLHTGRSHQIWLQLATS